MYNKLFEFEEALAKFTGAPYAVVTDGCTNALELCMRYDNVKSCSFTAFTYLSIPMLVRKLGINFTYINDPDWIGEYQFVGTRIWDSARLLKNNMYRPGQLQCLSFGNTKPLQLGRVGAILLDNYKDYEALSRMRSDGRDLRIVPWPTQEIFELGFHFCPTLELCELGTRLLPSVNQTPKFVQYNDCSKLNIV